MKNKIKGDVVTLTLNGSFDVLVHGNNCFNIMGAGIAKTIAIRVPESKTVNDKTLRGDKNKLGTYSSATVTTNHGHTFTIVNGYTQYKYGKASSRNIDYDALRNVFKQVAIDFKDKHIAYPRIGAGYAGGSWVKIYKIICEELIDCEHTYVVDNRYGV